MSVTKDQKSRSRDRLQPAGPASGGPVIAGPVPSDFVRIAVGETNPRPIGDSGIPFVFIAAIDEIDISHLTTSGFEGVERPEVESHSKAAVPLAPPAPVESPRPSFAPLLKSVPATTPVFEAEYEPMEFLDFDEPIAEEIVEPEPEPEPDPPPMAVDFLAVPVRFVNAPAPAKLVQGVSDVPMPALPVHPPELNLTTVRRKMVSGPDPSRPAPPVFPAPAPVSKPAQPVVVRSAPAVKQLEKATPPPAPQQKPAPAPSPIRVTKPTPEVKPAQPEQEKPRIAVRPAPPAPAESPVRTAAPPPAKPAMAARDRGGSALAVSMPEEEPVAAPLPKPKLTPIRKLEAVPVTETEPFRSITSPVQSAGMSPIVKGGIAAAAVVVLGLGGYFGFAGKGSTSSSAAASSGTDVTAPGSVMGGGGWTTTWGVDSPVNQNKQISIYRPSMALTDYRFEFRGQIEKKALGWIFRASNPKNYYVMKLEMIKAGASPIVALMKYAVIDGKETTHTQVMLPLNVSLDTTYSVRLDVKGDKFATYVQDKLVDHWTDSRIKTGGTGFYSEKGERAQIKSSQVSYLTAGR